MPLTEQQRAAIRLYKYQRLERVQNAARTEANPSGVRTDEWAHGQPKPQDQRGENVSDPQAATGPKTPYIAPDKKRGRWIRLPSGAERFVPSANFVPRREEKPAEKEASVPEIHIVSVPNTGSHVAVGKDGRWVNREACGPLGVPYQEPNK